MQRGVRLAKAVLVAALFICSNRFTADVAAASSQGSARSRQMKITIGTTPFTGTLEQNPTARAFEARLPITVEMADLNANEKFFDLLTSLPTRPGTPRTIQSGDLMLYGARTVVLFYRTFATTYSYTRLGHIDNPKGLAAALGNGNATVTFEPREGKDTRLNVGRPYGPDVR